MSKAWKMNNVTARDSLIAKLSGRNSRKQLTAFNFHPPTAHCSVLSMLNCRSFGDHRSSVTFWKPQNFTRRGIKSESYTFLLHQLNWLAVDTEEVINPNRCIGSALHFYWSQFPSPFSSPDSFTTLFYRQTHGLLLFKRNHQISLNRVTSAV